MSRTPAIRFPLRPHAEQSTPERIEGAGVLSWVSLFLAGGCCRLWRCVARLLERPDAVRDARRQAGFAIATEQGAKDDVAIVSEVGKAHGDSHHALVVFLRDALGFTLGRAFLFFLGSVLGLPALHLAFEDLVVDLALHGIGEDGVSVAYFLEGVVGLGFAAEVPVGMPFHRGTTVCASDLVLCGVGLDAERGVEGGHGPEAAARGRRVGVHPSMGSDAWNDAGVSWADLPTLRPLTDPANHRSCIMASRKAHHATGWAAAVIAVAVACKHGIGGWHWMSAAVFVAAVLGSTAPDWMEVAWWSKSRRLWITHRTWTHWGVAWLGLLAWSYTALGTHAIAAPAFGFACGGVMHLLADWPNPLGVPWIAGRHSLKLWNSGRCDLIVVAASWMIALVVSDDLWFQGRHSLALLHHLGLGSISF